MDGRRVDAGSGKAVLKSGHRIWTHKSELQENTPRRRGGGTARQARVVKSAKLKASAHHGHDGLERGKHVGVKAATNSTTGATAAEPTSASSRPHRTRREWVGTSKLGSSASSGAAKTESELCEAGFGLKPRPSTHGTRSCASHPNDSERRPQLYVRERHTHTHKSTRLPPHLTSRHAAPTHASRATARPRATHPAARGQRVPSSARAHGSLQLPESGSGDQIGPWDMSHRSQRPRVVKIAEALQNAGLEHRLTTLGPVRPDAKHK